MPSSTSLIARARNLPAPLQGAFLMTVAALLFAVMNAGIKLAAEEGLHPFQIAFFRNAFALMFMLPWLARMGFGALRTDRLKVHLWRAGIGLVAMLCWFTAIVVMPMADAVALNFTVPLFATAGAAIFLGEIVRARRWTATIVGFLGVLIILRPGFVEITPVMTLPVIAACFMAVTVLIVKSLSRTEEPMAVVLYMNLLLTPLSLIPALFVWQMPSLRALLFMVFVGACAVLAHIAFTRAFAKADASAILPFDYARLPFVAAIGFLLFGEQPDLWTWVGAAVIAASAVYIANREARIAKERPTHRPGSEAVKVKT
ncbi:DMT family transporter [Pelagibius litoralis]|uniref:DMT family transporter n=1 Tax=Pelagibius litoralis TaxID=374515 RepID=A0A967C644_9PROT|nr:DMT family transporter [Pelagibius litoralis]NIA68156.1 DMT family transporter [Pelagibius litoralis]